MTGPISIRPVLVEEREAFIDMALRSWRDAYVGLLPEEDVAAAPQMLLCAWDARWPQFRAASLDRRLAGYYSLGDAETAATRNCLWHPYVDPDLQRSGVGRELNRAALAEIAQRGAETAWLDVLEGNAKARAFYAALGWREAGRDPDEPQLVPMERDVGR